MARPKNKAELLEQANGQFEKLQMLIASMPDKVQRDDFLFLVTEKDKEAHWLRDKNLRDVLIHLYEWHGLLLEWVSQNQLFEGGKPIAFLPPPYTWKNYRGMNEAFTAKHKMASLEDSKKLLVQSHAAVLALIESFSDDELFTKAYFKWSGTTSVGAYCVSATSSHYDWAMKKVKRQIKASV